MQSAVTKLSRPTGCLRCKRPTTCLHRNMIAGTVNAGQRMMLELSLLSPETQEVIKVMQDRVHGSMFHISCPAKCP